MHVELWCCCISSSALRLVSPVHGLVQVVAYDFGIKHNILRRLASFGCKLTVVPADYPAEKVLEMTPDGIFLSNGPVSSSAHGLQWHMALFGAPQYGCHMCK